MKGRMLAVLLALPLLAFDCGGEDELDGLVPCRLHVSGAATEDLWCIVAAHDYSVDPVPLDQWGFVLTAYRGSAMAPEVGGGVGLFLGGRPALGTPYGWSGATRSALLTDGSATRYAPGGGSETHSALSLAETGSFSVVFTRTPPAGATGEQAVDVHGSLTATLPSVSGGAPVTFTATF